MRRLLSVSLLLFVCAIAKAQEVHRIMAQDICQCVNEDGIDVATAEKTQLQSKFGLCFAKAFGKLNTEEQESLHVDFGDKAVMRKLGADIALQMLSFCPETIMGLGLSELAAEEQDEDDLETEDQADTPDPRMTATVVGIKKGQFLSLVVKDGGGREHTLLFLWDFGTTGLLTGGGLKKNDEVELTYTEVEFYDVAIKDFRTYKIISSLRKY